MIFGNWIDMYTGDIDILELIPQRPPFVLIDRLEDFGETCSVTSFRVPEGGVLVRDGRLSEAGLMENIAQSCAARIGYINKCLKHDTVKLGIIGSVKDLEVLAMPAVGAELRTEVKVLSEVFNITLVEACVREGETELARCQMKISLTDIDKEG